MTQHVRFTPAVRFIIFAVAFPVLFTTFSPVTSAAETPAPQDTSVDTEAAAVESLQVNTDTLFTDTTTYFNEGASSENPGEWGIIPNFSIKALITRL